MMTNTNIDAKVTQIELLEAQVKELNAVIDSLKSDLKAELDEQKVDMINTGLNKIWYKAFERTSVDTQALREAGLYDKFSKKSVNLMFRITKSK